MSPHIREELLPRLVAGTAAVALLVLCGRLLLAHPGLQLRPQADAQASRIQLRFMARPRPAAAVMASGPVRATSAQDGQPTPAHAGQLRGVPAASAAIASATAPGTALALYDAQGRIQLPAGAVPPSPATRNERDPLERDNPIDYRATRFEDAWISDGDVADVVQQELKRAQQKMAEMVFGKDVQPAQARPPPEVRYNPARHERTADLGSEATGDAWRAAPINYEPAPGLEGEASRRIRQQVAALERGHAGCDARRVEALMAPVRQALDALQRVEYAHARGADPIRARHELPATANSAWDQARRALWYAEKQLEGCRVPRAPAP